MLRIGSVLFTTAVALLGQKAPPGTVVAGEAGPRLDAAMAAKAGFWGAVLAAVDGQVVFAKGYGMADFQKVPIGPHSLFDLGNATHQLTSVLVLRLAQEHRVALDAPVGKQFKDWPADKAAITWQHLLTMTSGLPSDASWAEGAAGANRTAVAAIGRVALLAPPGGPFFYSALNGNLLGLASEEVAGGRFDKLLVDRVLKPAGMVDGGPCNGRFDDKLVTWRRQNATEPGAPASAFDLNWAHRGARGVLVSAYDLHELLRRLCGDKLLGDDLRTRLWQPVGVNDAYCVDRRTVGDREFVRVRGNVAGYRARWCIAPASRTWLVVLTGLDGELDGLEGELLGLLTPPPAATPTAATAAPVAPADHGVAAAAAAAATWQGQERARFEGEFELPDNGGRFAIRRTGEGVVLAGAGLQASARLAEGHWPVAGEAALRRALDRGLWLAERLAADDAGVDQDAFVDAAAGTAARALVRGWLATHGPLQGVEFVGTAVTPTGSTSWLRWHGRGDVLVGELAWSDERRVAACTAATGPVPFAVPLAFARADCALAQSRVGTPLAVTIEGTAPRRTLVFEDASPDRGGLLECREVAPR